MLKELDKGSFFNDSLLRPNNPLMEIHSRLSWFELIGALVSSRIEEKFFNKITISDFELIKSDEDAYRYGIFHCDVVGEQVSFGEGFGHFKAHASYGEGFGNQALLYKSVDQNTGKVIGNVKDAIPQALEDGLIKEVSYGKALGYISSTIVDDDPYQEQLSRYLSKVQQRGEADDLVYQVRDKSKSVLISGDRNDFRKKRKGKKIRKKVMSGILGGIIPQKA